MRRRRTADRRIEDLRSRLADIDRRIVRDLAARERVQQTLLSYKRRRGVTLFDREQERVAERRAHRWAAEGCGDPELAEKVIHLSITSGKARFLSRATEGAGTSRRRKARHRPRPR